MRACGAVTILNRNVVSCSGGFESRRRACRVAGGVYFAHRGGGAP